MKYRVKQVATAESFQDTPPVVYVVLEDDRLLMGNWDRGNIQWTDITPDDKQIEPRRF
jgi:hypothetical protein